MWGSCLLKAWSKTVSTIALSTGEAELSALAKGTAEGLGMQSVLMDMGLNTQVSIESDATAAIGMAARQGLGRVRHISVADLWVQQRLKRGDITTRKVDGTQNPADLMTKPMDSEKISRFLRKLHIRLL